MIAAWTRGEVLAKARELRPELRAAQAEKEASVLQLRAAKQEATWPSFAVGVSYFAPTTFAPFNGYGLNASMSLPWLWGAASHRREAEERSATAAASEVEGARIAVEADVVTAESNVRAAALRLQVERDRVLPTTQRAFELAWGGYESGRTDLMTLLTLERSVVDAEHDLVMARAGLDHALADLDAAVGAPVPLRPLGPLSVDAGAVHHG
jgi:outer membrane protein TolC